MKLLEYINAKTGIMASVNTISSDFIDQQDKVIYYMSPSGIANLGNQISNSHNEPVLNVSLYKNNNSEYYFTYNTGYGIENNPLLQPFNCGNKIALIVKQPPNAYYGILEIYNVSKQQLLTPPAEEGYYPIDFTVYHMSSTPKIYIPSEGLFYGYEVYNDNQLIHNLVPMVEKNKAFLYDKITGKSYEILNHNNENAYFDLNYGPEIFAKTITLPAPPNKNGNLVQISSPHTIKVFPVDKEGKFYFDNSPLLYI